jgi:hypothetical protein
MQYCDHVYILLFFFFEDLDYVMKENIILKNYKTRYKCFCDTADMLPPVTCIEGRSIIYLTELGIGEIHLWMCLHELIQHLLLLHLITRWLAHLLLSLIEHHLLHSRTSFSI